MNHFFSIGNPDSQDSQPTSSRTMLLELVGLKTTCITNCVIATPHLPNTEKWALSYRHFEHKDTDTNMFVERCS